MKGLDRNPTKLYIQGEIFLWEVVSDIMGIKLIPVTDLEKRSDILKKITHGDLRIAKSTVIYKARD